MVDNSPAIECYGEHHLADVELGRKMVRELEKFYPNHAWFVNVNTEVGTLTIQLLYQDKGVTKKWAHGMLSHISNLTTDPEITQRAMLHGGELLERWGLARSGANPYTPLDAKGNNLDLIGAI